MRITRILLLVLCAGILLWNGCSFVDLAEFAAPGGKPNDKAIIRSYENIRIKESNSVDVLNAMYMPKYELISQSKSVIASGGEKKRGHEVWFNMAAFEEEGTEVVRKYIVLVDERPKKLFVEPWEGLRFDCESVIESKVLDEPYATENARRIAILKNVYKLYKEDLSQIEKDNKQTAMRGIMVNQGFETILLKLDEFPALAEKLDKEKGVEFDHMSLDRGIICMNVVGNAAKVKMRFGSFTRKFKCIEDVNDK